MPPRRTPTNDDAQAEKPVSPTTRATPAKQPATQAKQRATRAKQPGTRPTQPPAPRESEAPVGDAPTAGAEAPLDGGRKAPVRRPPPTTAATRAARRAPRTGSPAGGNGSVPGRTPAAPAGTTRPRRPRTVPAPSAPAAPTAPPSERPPTVEAPSSAGSPAPAPPPARSATAIDPSPAPTALVRTAFTWPAPVPHRPYLPAPAPSAPARPARRAQEAPRATRRQAAVIGAVGLGAALLLNAAAMARSAELSPFGWQRSASLAVLEPLATISRNLWLDRPRAALDALTGHDSSPPGDAPPPAAAAAPPRPTAAPTPPPVIQAPRLLTPANPLRLWSGGDSVEGFLGYQLTNTAAQTGELVVHEHYQVSSGLARPDFYDWPVQLRGAMAQFNPEAVIMLLGGNDNQGVQSPTGSVHDFGSRGWREEYSRRVGQIMETVTGQGRLMVWVGLPVMREGDYWNQMQLLNSVYREQAARHRGVLYVDAATLFSSPGGGYTAYLPDESGRTTLMRAQDGVHLTAAGGKRLESAVLTCVRRAVAQRDPVGTLHPAC